MTRHIYFSVAIVLAMAMPTAKADIIFSNLETPPYNPIGGYVIDSTQYIASRFVPGTNAYLGGVAVEAALYLGGPNDLLVQVALNNPLNNTPGIVLESYHILNQMVSYGSTSALVTAESTLEPLLLAGQPYWLIVAPGQPSTSAAWYFNFHVSGNSLRSSDGGSTWVAAGSPVAYAVYSAVPEPSQLVLLGLSMLGLVVSQRRRFKWHRHSAPAIG